ncbi:cellulose synthase, partial [Erwinia amylovora]|nr:cellulose synthase [Erwinia amylovora]
CVSCAVIRRCALEDFGGFEVVTLSEDEYTALNMQGLGWRTAFVAMPLAAGVASVRLGLHIVLRTRWPRGVSQIVRVAAPRLARGREWRPPL